MIYVIASIEIAPGRRQEFLEEFQKIVPLVRAEQGCVWYEPTLDLETNLAAQGAVREDVVTVVEQWADIEDLERHLMAPHMLDYRAKVKPLVVGSKLQILRPAAA
jgi:quinol monooxygenase YgiN